MYDLLYEKTLEEQKQAYKQVGKQYHTKELYRTDRAFMPMFAELSPKFARRFPAISNTFDNLHMLHDMVNDILASDWLTPQQKDEQITRAIWLVMAANHREMVFLMRVIITKILIILRKNQIILRDMRKKITNTITTKITPQKPLLIRRKNLTTAMIKRN